MRRKYYTFFIASTDSGKMRRMRVPHYALHVLVILAVVGGVTVTAAVGSYSRMLWKASAYNSLVKDQSTLTKQYQELQTQVKDANERLNSLQSLASDVAAAYGLTRVADTPFEMTNSSAESNAAYRQTADEFGFLQQNAAAVMLMSTGAMRFVPGKLPNASFIPSLWPVMGRITSPFGERLDPFDGEGEFHTGLDIASHYDDGVRAAADGVVTWTGRREGYGRVVILDHGFGITTWYAHLAAYDVQVGERVKRGEVVAQEGESGRATGPHVHFEVRINNTPVNPLPYLRRVDAGGTISGGG
jgi:murein DD-endopeptidase MepM/ murein hydrolase activator NlpD